MLLALSVCFTSIHAGIVITNNAQSGAFPLATEQGAATVFVSPDEAVVVQKAAQMLSSDIVKVTGHEAPLKTDSKVQGQRVVVIGTIGHNRFIDELMKKGQIDVGSIRRGWEQYIIQSIKSPKKGIDEALIIVGSDKRGTAYGALTVSEKIGVSPFYWWADIPVKRHKEIYLSGREASKEPSVKYRGIFINDEDWGLKPWASKNFERDLGDIGPKTYAKVCELILRLKGNMLGPAMHECTGAFYSHPESKLVADSFGIMITTSHCEPLLINTASKWEWDIKRDGDWNYKTNGAAIRKKWDDRLTEASRFDNIYTMAMRGLHDAGLRGNMPLDERTKVLDQVIKDQRALLTNHIRKPITQIPQIFVPYKETMDVYENGLKVPEYITLVWVDDNYGYMKRVSNPAEQQRSGRAGVYYHLSYLGAPHDYLWLNTTPPVLMYEELMKAYHTGADRYWLLNVGDIKPMELGIKLFFDLAWDVNSMDIRSVNKAQSQFLAGIYGQGYRNALQDILDQYYRLAWSRKPEFMGWEREWDDSVHTGLRDTEYSFSNYSEAQRRLRDYRSISDKVRDLMTELPSDQRPSFFEMVAFPVMGAYQMNRKFLMAQLNHEMAKAGKRSVANWAARQMDLAYDSINALNHQYNSLLDGKWNGMMALAPAWCSLTHLKPQVQRFKDAGEEPVDLSVRPTDNKNCMALNLSEFIRKSDHNHKISVIHGLGYDWKVLQLGLPTEEPSDAMDINGDGVEYRLPEIPSDSISVTIYTVPYWPLFKGRGTKIGVSIDGSEPQVFDNRFKEYGKSWKDQVLRNGAVCHLKFSIDKYKGFHSLLFLCGDPGQMIEKVVIDWGGLKTSYLGPEPCD